MVSSQWNTHRSVSKLTVVATVSWHLSRNLDLSSHFLSSNPHLNPASFSPIFISHSFRHIFAQHIFEGSLGVPGAEEKVVNCPQNVKTVTSTNSRWVKWNPVTPNTYDGNPGGHLKSCKSNKMETFRWYNITFSKSLNKVVECMVLHGIARLASDVHLCSNQLWSQGQVTWYKSSHPGPTSQRNYRVERGSPQNGMWDDENTNMSSPSHT